MPDLAERVHATMTEIASDNAMSGFEVYRHTEDGTAAVQYRPGIVDAYTAVLRWTLTGWAEKLRDRGYTVEVVVRDDRGEKGVPQWLKVTAWTEPTGDGGASRTDPFALAQDLIDAGGAYYA